VLLLFAILWQDWIASNVLGGKIASITGTGTPLQVWHASRFDHLRRSLDAEARGNYSAETRIEPEIRLIAGHESGESLSNVYSNALVDDQSRLVSGTPPILRLYTISRPAGCNLD
jgi:hypothetical protein